MTRIWLRLLDKLIKMLLRVSPLLEAVRGKAGAHNHSLFIQDARVDHEHKYLDLEQFVFMLLRYVMPAI